MLPILLRAQGKDVSLANGLDRKLLKLMEGLHQKRCLLILDNAETILSAGQTGQYHAGYEGYGQLSLIEKEDERFFLQPMVLEYITNQLVDCAKREIATQTSERCISH